MYGVTTTDWQSTTKQQQKQRESVRERERKRDSVQTNDGKMCEWVRLKERRLAKCSNETPKNEIEREREVKM